MSAEHSQIKSHSITLVGLMGVGKTTVGRRLAKTLDLPFFDSDDEIEKASARTVKGYFKDYGEAAFRDGERRVIERLLDGPPIVLATGGGAFIPEDTRTIIQAQSTTVWLHADFETIFDRASRKNTRPLLDVEDPKTTLKALMIARYPIYELAQLKICAGTGSHNATVTRITTALKDYYYDESA